MAASGGYWKGGSFTQMKSSEAFNKRMSDLTQERARLSGPKFPGTKKYRDFQELKAKEQRAVLALNDFLARRLVDTIVNG